MDLVINSEVDVLSEDADWPSLIDNFASQIDKYTKNDIAKTITADFSTTTSVERIASQITLMESVKSYFEFIVTYMSCGIPYITLEGTPNDWQQVLEKTRKLGSYGKLGKWTQDLEPILNEFIFASEGQPNHNFWRQMVKKQRVDRLKGGGCSSEEPTKLDGWMLKLFPDENGNTLSSIYHTKNMPTEYVKVGFKYCVIDPGQGMITNETPMELWAGFIGAEDDTINNMLTPKIGWLVCSISQNNDELLKELKDRWAIELRVQEVPEVLSRIEHIRNLRLEFTDKVVIPEWFYNMSIDNLSIKGDVTKEDNPGGFMNMDETTEQCAVRELEEETGLKVTEIKQIGAYSKVDRDPRGRTVTVAYLVVIDKAEAVKGGDDAAKAQWFPISGLPKLAFDHEEIMKDAKRLFESL